MKRVPFAVAAVTLAVGLFAVGVAWAGRSEAPSEKVLGPGAVTVELTMRHSRFEPDLVRVRPGTTVTFVVSNADPITHELIVGDDEVHQRHEVGTEPAHEPRPGEVTVAALTAESTTFEFPSEGDVLFACHLPGHFRYGMSGQVTVTGPG